MTLAGHSGTVETVAVSPDGLRIFSGGEDGVVRAWDARTGRELVRFDGHTGPVRELTVDPGTRSVVSVGDDGTIRVWDPENGLLRLTLATDASLVDGLALVPGASTIIMSYGGMVRLWDLRNGRRVGQFEGSGPVAASPDGRRFAHGVSQGFAVRDFESRDLLYSAEGSTALAFSPRGGRLASSYDRWVYVNDGETGRELTRFIAFSHSTPALLITADERYLVTGHKHGEVKIWDFSTFEELHYAEGGSGFVRALVPLDGRRFIVLGTSGRSVTVWDAESGRLLQTLAGHADRVTAAAVIPGTAKVVTASRDGTLVVWDTKYGPDPEVREGGGRVYRLMITPDRRRVVSGCWTGMSAWDAVDGRVLWADETGHPRAVSPDGARVFVTGGYRDQCWIKVWEMETRREVLALTHPYAWDTLVTKDGSRIVSAAADVVQPDLRIWDALTGDELHRLSAESPLRFSRGERAVIARRPFLVLEARDPGTGETFGRVDVPRGYKKAWLIGDGSRAIGQVEPGVFEVLDGRSGRVLFVMDARGPGEGSLAHESDFHVDGSSSRLIVCRARSLEVRDPLSGKPFHSSAFDFRIDMMGRPKPQCVGGGRYILVRIDRTIRKEWRLLECDTGRTAIDLQGLRADALALSADGTHLAVASNGALGLWDIRRRVQGAGLEGACEDAPTDLTVARGGGFVAAKLKDDTLLIWNTSTSRLERVPAAGPVAASPDGRWLAFSTHGDGGCRLNLWDLRAGGPVRSEGCSQGIASLAFGPEGHGLVLLSKEARRVCFDLRTGRETSLPPDEMSAGPEPGGAAGELDVVPIGDRTAGVKDRLSGQLLARFPCPERILDCVGERREAVVSAQSGGLVVVGGQEAGGVYILRLEGGGADKA